MLIFVNARFVTQELSGVQRYAIEISKEIKKQYPEAKFLSPKNQVNKELSDLLDIKTIGNNSGHLWEQFDLYLYLKKFKDQTPFLINLANTAPFLFKNNILVIHDLAVFKSNDWNSNLFRNFYRFLLPRMARKSKHVFTVSETIKKEIVKTLNIPESKIDVTYNGLSEGFLKEVSSPIKKQKIILTVGSINKRKNHVQLIQSFIKLHEDDYKLIIVGHYSKNYCYDKDLHDLLSANKNIELLTTVNDKQLIELYSNAAIFVYLSNYEGFGVPILEALHFNCQVLSSDLEVFHEIYGTAINYCDQNNLDSIVSNLKRCIGKNESIKNESSNLEQKYNYRIGAKKILDILNCKTIFK